MYVFINLIKYYKYSLSIYLSIYLSISICPPIYLSIYLVGIKIIVVLITLYSRCIFINFIKYSYLSVPLFSYLSTDLRIY